MDQAKQRLDTLLTLLMGDSAKMFMKKLEDCGGFISGSILLQALTNEFYSSSDIDVYVPLNLKESGMVELMQSMGFEWYEDWLNSQMWRYGGSLDENFMPIPVDQNHFGVYNFRKTLPGAVGQASNIGSIKDVDKAYRFKIQIICREMKSSVLQNTNRDSTCRRNDLREWVMNTFDYDFLKNFYLPDGNGGTTIYVHDMKAVTSKTGNFRISPGNNLQGAWYRYHKYTDRGFKIAVAPQYNTNPKDSVDGLEMYANHHELGSAFTPFDDVLTELIVSSGKPINPTIMAPSKYGFAFSYAHGRAPIPVPLMIQV